MGRELNEFSLHSRDGIKLNGRLGKDKWGVGERIIERERLSRDLHRELNKFRDGIKLNGRLGKDKRGGSERIIERETEQGVCTES